MAGLLRSRRTLGVALSIGALFTLTACGGDDAFDDDTDGDTGGETSQPETSEGTGSEEPAAGGSLTVGGANFTEMLVMQEIYAAALRDAGYDVEIVSVENREQYEPSAESGDIDVIPDYAATLTEYLNLDENGPDAEPVATGDVAATVEALRALAEPRGLTVLDASEAASQNAFFVTQEFADANALETLSDLGGLGEPLVLAAAAECPERPFCEPGLEQTYGLDITEVLPLGYGTLETKDAVTNGEAQVGQSGTTDGSLAAAGLVVLEDDQSLQLADNITPVVNTETLEANPEIEAILDAISQALTTEILAELNTRIDVDRELPADVATDFLTEQGLIGA